MARNCQVRAENLDLAALPIQAASDPASQGQSRLEGQLRATIDASGNLTEPAKGRATIALDALEGMWNGRPFTVMSPSPIQYADERLTVEKVEVAASDVSLTVTGELPLTDEAGTGAIDVDLHGSLATLTQFLPPDTNIAGDGAVALTGSLRGTLAADRSRPDADRGQRADPDATPRARLFQHRPARPRRERRGGRGTADRQLGHGDTAGLGPHPAGHPSRTAGGNPAHEWSGDVQGGVQGSRPIRDSGRTGRS